MNLARAQLISLFSKGVTTVLGTIQSLVIAWLLGPDQFGLVGLVMTVGGVIGVSQHLGIVDGTIREVAVLKKLRDIGSVVWVSTLVRQAITLPLSFALIFLAEPIASGIYHKPEIIPYLRLFASALILFGFQDVLGAALTGMKHFITLYLIQIVTAALNIIAFGYFIWAYQAAGYFYAMLITTFIMVGLFAFVIIRQLGEALLKPTWREMRQVGKQVIKVGVFMYPSRVAFVLWQRLPILVLGGVLAIEQVGYITIASAFGARLAIIAAALSEVNLSWMSSLFSSSRQEFARVAQRNMQRVFMMMMLLTLVLLFFTPEILWVIGNGYEPAKHYIFLLTLAFFFYSLLDIGTNSILVAANNAQARAALYTVLVGLPAIVIGWLYASGPSALAACFAVLLGSFVTYCAAVWYAKSFYGIALLNRRLIFLLIILGASAAWLWLSPILLWRIILFMLISGLVFRELIRGNLLPNPYMAEKGLARKRQDSRTAICFAGALYQQQSWTNRQHIMSRLSQKMPVLYVEPRLWIMRYFWKNWRSPKNIMEFLTRLAFFEKVSDTLFIKAQWNILPGSREFAWISRLNFYLNRWHVLLCARRLGFLSDQTMLWLYDTEAAEYLPAFPKAYVLYDCVDDHAAQAGVDRNPKRVETEESHILKRANLVTVTSRKLLELKKAAHTNTHFVLNAGDVETYEARLTEPVPPHVARQFNSLNHPIVGSVGALDSYKFDFDLLLIAAQAKPQWQFVFIGEPMVDGNQQALRNLQKLSNVHLLGAVDHRAVAWYVSFFDVCMIPYRSNRYNEASFPLKFWEFMVTGKPLVVTGLPELKAYQELITYAENSDAFIKGIELALSQPGQKAKERRELARQHSWQHRLQQILDLLPSQ